MNVASLNEGLKTTEDRKRYRLRKEMNTAYKKNTEYQNVSKQTVAHFINQLLEENDTAEKEKHSKQNNSNETETNEQSQQPLQLPINTLPLFFYITPSISTKEQQIATTEEEGKLPEVVSPIDIPVRFLKNIEIGIHQDPFFGKNIERQIFQRMYNTAISKYTFHMEMAQNKFHMYESTFSQIA